MALCVRPIFPGKTDGDVSCAHGEIGRRCWTRFSRSDEAFAMRNQGCSLPVQAPSFVQNRQLSSTWHYHRERLIIVTPHTPASALPIAEITSPRTPKITCTRVCLLPSRALVLPEVQEGGRSLVGSFYFPRESLRQVQMLLR